MPGVLSFAIVAAVVLGLLGVWYFWMRPETIVQYTKQFMMMPKMTSKNTVAGDIPGAIEFQAGSDTNVQEASWDYGTALKDWRVSMHVQQSLASSFVVGVNTDGSTGVLLVMDEPLADKTVPVSLVHNGFTLTQWRLPAVWDFSLIIEKKGGNLHFLLGDKILSAQLPATPTSGTKLYLSADAGTTVTNVVLQRLPWLALSQF